MKVVKCDIPDCEMYITEDEAKVVMYKDEPIMICEICDDGSHEAFNNRVGGYNYEAYNKVEKIKKNRKKRDY